MKFSIDEGYTVDTLQRLVQINSVNPDLTPDAPGEEAIAAYIADSLRDMGVEPQIETLGPKRANVVGVLTGSGGGRSLMLNAHTDTVGVQGMQDPFSGAVTDGRLYGRGAYDMKGSAAAMLAAVKALVESDVQLHGDLVLAFVADEEYASIGTQQVLKSFRTDAAIVTEPSDLAVCLAHKGYGLFEFVTTGRAAHGSKPEDGVDANMHMGRIIAELERVSEKLRGTEPHPLLGRPSMHVPVIAGGTEPFTYAAECRMQLERRTLPGETERAILSELRTMIARLSDQNETFAAEVKTVLWRDAFEADRSSELVSLLSEAVSSVTKAEPKYIGHPWWEDSALISAAGIDTVIIGPTGQGLHSAEEWVDIQSVVDLAGILAQTAATYCGKR